MDTKMGLKWDQNGTKNGTKSVTKMAPQRSPTPPPARLRGHGSRRRALEKIQKNTPRSSARRFKEKLVAHLVSHKNITQEKKIGPAGHLPRF